MWRVSLLGTTTAVCGFLEIPAVNGVLPEALLYSNSLMHDDIGTNVLIVDRKTKLRPGGEACPRAKAVGISSRRRYLVVRRPFSANGTQHNAHRRSGRVLVIYTRKKAFSKVTYEEQYHRQWSVSAKNRSSPIVYRSSCLFLSSQPFRLKLKSILASRPTRYYR